MAVSVANGPEPPVVASRKPARPIRILFVIDTIWDMGGAEGCLLRMTKHLPADQFECSVLTFYTGKLSAKFIEKFDCPVYHWQINNLYDRTAFQVARRLYRFVRDQKIDIVHTFFQTSDLWAGPIAKLAGARVQISSRRDMGILRQRKHHIGYRLMRGFFDQVQTVSDGVRRYTIEKDGIDPTSIVTIYNGIDPNLHVTPEALEETRVKYELPSGPPVITMAANSRPVKGTDLLVRAAAIITKEVPYARFLVAGGFGGSECDRKFTEGVMQLSESLGVSKSVRFLGRSDHVAELFSLSDVYVAPSRSEGLSNALLEAMRAGLPCVATSVGGNPEVVLDGDTGFLVPTEDVPMLADRVLRLLRDPQMRTAMGRAGRARFLKHFTVQAMVDKLEGAYFQALARSSGSEALRNDSLNSVADY